VPEPRKASSVRQARLIGCRAVSRRRPRPPRGEREQPPGHHIVNEVLGRPIRRLIGLTRKPNASRSRKGAQGDRSSRVAVPPRIQPAEALLPGVSMISSPIAKRLPQGTGQDARVFSARHQLSGRVRGGSEKRMVQPSTAEHGRGHLTRSHGAVCSCAQLLSYARGAARSQPTREGRPNGRVSVQARASGRHAGEPSSFSSAVPNWGPGETIHFGHKTLRVVGVRDDDADQPPVLVVEDVVQSGQTGTAA
jgi:hypothetical protein